MTDRIPLDHLTSDQYDALYDERDRYARLLRTLTTAPDAPAHCHEQPPTWDGGGPCTYCTALLEARTTLAKEPAP